MLRVFLVSGFLLVALTGNTALADCRGCCSHHGGVVCENGETKCKDGTPLSFKCESKGCNKCGKKKPKK